MTTKHQLLERIEREDLVMFINACFACTGQTEFYSDGSGQSVSIDFLHRYILGNYRRLYARTLAAGINHFNQGQIIVNLLAAGAPKNRQQREEEGRLVQYALRKLPPQRAFKVLLTLREKRVNNRRSRAVARDFLASRSDPAFDAVKYRTKVRNLVTHAHLKLNDERSSFLFRNWQKREYTTVLFDKFRQAHYAKEAVYELPFSVAQGLAAKHGIGQKEFLSRIQDKMTVQERLRSERSAQRMGAKSFEANLEKIPLTQLAVFILGLPADERQAQRDRLEGALSNAAFRAFKRAPRQLGRVAAVLDRSYSTSGSSEKRRRPLAVALAASSLLKKAASEYQAFWTVGTPDELLVTPYGQTNLVDPLIEAFKWRPDVIVVVSDGYENDPPFGVSEVVRVFRKRIDTRHTTSIVHVNPVFDSDNYAPRTISPFVPTVGLRDAEDLLTVLGFARFAEGSEPLAALEEYLVEKAKELLREGEVKR